MKNKFIYVLAMILLINVNVFAVRIGIEEGNQVLDFEISDIKGNSYNNKDLLGKTVILHFWASWCPPCKEELPEYNAFYNENKNRNIEFITVSVDNSERALINFLKKVDTDFTIFHDKVGLARKFLVRAIPTTYIINEKGIIVKKQLGSIAWNNYNLEQIKSGDF